MTFFYKLGFILALGVIIFGLAVKMPVKDTVPPIKETSLERVLRIAAVLRTETGLPQLVPVTISVDPSNILNAYNTGDSIVIYQGLIDKVTNDDELALVIGHEMSHSTLMHMGDSGLNPSNDPALQSILESQADKMGAIYMMKAGYDICKGREFFKIMGIDPKEADFPKGDDHPSDGYRYKQLNINCGA